MMTREENICQSCAHSKVCKFNDGESSEYCNQHLAISALRPVSREQVEKSWPGCDICRGDKKIKSDNFCGAATMQIIGDSIDLRGNEKKIKFFGHIYAPSFSVRFCPICGKPLTDEAVEMVMERMEKIK